MWPITTVRSAVSAPMATTESTSQSQSTGFLAGVVRVVLVVLFTGVETVALVAWLALVLDAATVSQTAAIGLGALFVTQTAVVEPLLTDLGVSAVGPETVGVAVLAVALLVEHVIGVGFSRRS